MLNAETIKRLAETEHLIELLEEVVRLLKSEHAEDSINYYGVSTALKECAKAFRRIGFWKRILKS